MSLELGTPLAVGWAVALLWLVLFAARRRVGHSPLVAAIVGLHALAVTHYGYVEPAPGLRVATSWLTITAWPLLALLVYVRDGAHRTRQLGMAILVGTFAVTLAAAALVPDPLSLLIRGLARGVLAFFAAIATVITWEILSHARVPVLPRIIGSVLLSLAFDATANGSFEALLAEEPFEAYVLGSLSIAVLAAGMHGAFGALWLLVLEGERWTSRTERSLLQVLTMMVGIRRYETLRPDLVRDPSSGVYHRTFLEDRAPVELERAAHLAARVAVVMIEARDEPQRVGRALLSCTRLTDLPARWSDQRFIAMMPGADRDAARVTAIRIVQGFRGEAAVGIAIFPTDGLNLEELVDRARRHLKPALRD